MAKRSIGGTLSVDQSTQNIALEGTFHLMLINDGADEVYIKIVQDEITFTSVTTSDFQLRAGETLVLDTDTPYGYVKMNIRCNTGETASLRYLAWY